MGWVGQLWANPLVLHRTLVRPDASYRSIGCTATSEIMSAVSLLLGRIKAFRAEHICVLWESTSASPASTTAWSFSSGSTRWAPPQSMITGEPGQAPMLSRQRPSLASLTP